MKRRQFINLLGSDEALHRIISGFPEPRPRYVQLELDNRIALPMDPASADATAVLSQIGVEMAAQADVRTDLRPFFA